MSDLTELGFDANTEEPNTGFDVLPAGDYEVCITASEMKITNSGDGKYLHLQMQVLSGPAKNRFLFDRLNVVNPNADAVRIARATLSSICRAVGVMTPQDSTQLHDKPMLAKVGIRKSDQYGEQNTIKGYKPLAGGVAPPPLPGIGTPSFTAEAEQAARDGSVPFAWLVPLLCAMNCLATMC